MKGLIAAIQFLTTIPMPVKTETKDFQAAVKWFPTAGAIIGTLCAGTFWCLHQIAVPPQISSLVVTLLLVLLSGGLHLDGLADSFDGIFSHRSKDRMLEIMHDSAIGTMGVLGLIFIILLKWAGLTLLFGQPSPYRSIALVPILSRALMTFWLLTLPYVRETGFAKQLKEGQSPYLKWLLLTLSLALAIALLQWNGVVLFSLMFLAGALFKQKVLRILGGITGDTTGASLEIMEATGFLVAATVGSIV